MCIPESLLPLLIQNPRGERSDPPGCWGVADVSATVVISLTTMTGVSWVWNSTNCLEQGHKAHLFCQPKSLLWQASAQPAAWDGWQTSSAWNCALQEVTGLLSLSQRLEKCFTLEVNSWESPQARELLFLKEYFSLIVAR